MWLLNKLVNFNLWLGFKKKPVKSTTRPSTAALSCSSKQQVKLLPASADAALKIGDQVEYKNNKGKWVAGVVKSITDDYCRVANSSAGR